MSQPQDLVTATRIRHGGYWGEHPDYPVEQWRNFINERLTRLGYWEWVVRNLDATGSKHA